MGYCDFKKKNTFVCDLKLLELVAWIEYTKCMTYFSENQPKFSFQIHIIIYLDTVWSMRNSW